MIDWSYFLDSCTERPNRGWHGIIKYMTERKHITKDEGMPLLDLIEQHFMWNNYGAITKKWVGISHLTPDPPFHWAVADFNRLFSNAAFLKSLKYCHCMIFLSDYMERDFRKKTGGLVNTISLKHPVGDDIAKFDFSKFKEADKKIVLLGQQLRRVSSLYEIESNLKKVWFPGLTSLKDAKHRRNADLMANNLIPYVDIDLNSVEIKYTEDLNEYDKTINENIVIVDVYDASANNSVLEHISATSPFFCKKTPSTKEYLGEDYPMFFEELNEIEKKLKNEKELLDLYESTHLYLKNLDKTSMSYEYFSNKMLECISDA